MNLVLYVTRGLLKNIYLKGPEILHARNVPIPLIGQWKQDSPYQANLFKRMKSWVAMVCGPNS